MRRASGDNRTSPNVVCRGGNSDNRDGIADHGGRGSRMDTSQRQRAGSRDRRDQPREALAKGGARPNRRHGLAYSPPLK